MTEQEFVVWAKRLRAPLEMAFAQTVCATVAKHSKRLTKFVGWWLTAVGASAGVLAANFEEARKLFGVRGFKFDFALLVFAALLGLWSQYRGTQAQKALALVTSMVKGLPPILEKHRALAKQLDEAEGKPRGTTLVSIYREPYSLVYRCSPGWLKCLQLMRPVSQSGLRILSYLRMRKLRDLRFGSRSVRKGWFFSL